MIVALAGGVGGSKLVLGFSKLLPPDQLSIIGNTGDDIELFGLRICPDLDTLTYTLSGLVNPLTGWGIREDSFTCLEAMTALGASSWFKLGDRDLATHLWRTSQLNQGDSLTRVTAHICRSLGVEHNLLPMTDSYVPTHVLTDQGELHLQEYLVREACRPIVRGFKSLNMEKAQLTPDVTEAIMAARAVFLCPSNPFISINPILAVPGLRELLSRTQAPVIAVTPIVEGGALKGPAAKMLQEQGYPVNPVSIARMYQDFLDCFVLDERDTQWLDEIESLKIRVLTADTLMDSLQDKISLADHLLESL
ncbi:MAG: 2-phospho-L-lactate transferase [Acidobacteriota bacterium]